MIIQNLGFLGQGRGEAYEIDTYSYSSKSTSVTSQAATPNDVAFSDDGLMMYALDNTNNTVYQYSVATAWDLGSTVTYLSKSHSINSEDATPVAMFFKPDGLKMYIVGSTNDSVFEYTISTAWDLGSTVTYTSNSKSLSSEGANPHGIHFNSAGTKMYVLDTSARDVNEYTISTAWDLGSTVSYSSNTKTVASEDTVALGLTFNGDGTKMYISGSTNDKVFQYSLSTAWDLGSTVTYETKNLDVSGESSTPSGIVFDADGTNFFLIDVSSDRVFQYNL